MCVCVCVCVCVYVCFKEEGADIHLLKAVAAGRQVRDCPSPLMTVIKVTTAVHTHTNTHTHTHTHTHTGRNHVCQQGISKGALKGMPTH